MKHPVAIFITDTHLSENTVDINNSIFNQVVDLAIKLKVKKIIHLGDVFTSRKGQPEVVLTAFNSILDSIHDAGLSMTAIPGNHDKASYISSESYLTPFSNHPAFTLVSNLEVINLEDINLFMIPYFDEKLSYLTYIKQALILSKSVKGTKVLGTHVSIDGVKSNSGVTVENELKEDLFECFDLVLVGHYHDRQLLGSRDHIVYMGSAYQANFGEDDKKGCAVLYSDGSYEFIQLDFTKYITVHADISSIPSASHLDENNKYRIKLSGKITKDKEAELLKLSEMGVKIETSSIDFVESTSQSSDSISLSSNDILESFEEWGIEKQYEDLDFGRNLLKSAII